MFYTFPTINNISDVLPAIEGHKEFIVAEKEHFTVVNYVLQTPDTFSRKELGWEVRRECRGIKFSNGDGRILQRPLHKFFNLGENEEVLSDNIPWQQEEYIIVEKMDGSMTAPILLDGNLRLTTKMGITSVALQAEVFLAKNPALKEWMKSVMSFGVTPIFEYVGPNNRIVIDYKEENLVYLCARSNLTGKYVDVEMMEGMRNTPLYDLTVYNEIKHWKDKEGIVISFHNGHKLKMKADHYVALHRAKDAVQREHDLVSLIVNEQLDDAKAVMDKETREKVEAFEKQFHEERNIFELRLEAALKYYFEVAEGDRKRFALMSDKGEEVNPLFRSLIFSLWDKKETSTEVVLRSIRKACVKQESWADFTKRAGMTLEWKGVLFQ